MLAVTTPMSLRQWTLMGVEGPAALSTRCLHSAMKGIARCIHKKTTIFPWDKFCNIFFRAHRGLAPLARAL